MKNQPSVSTDIVRLLLRYASKRGIDPQTILRESQMDQHLLAQADNRLSVARFTTLWDTVAAAVGDPHFGLHFGASQHTPPEGSILFAVMINCRTLGEAIAKLARYHALVTDFIRLEGRQVNGTARFFLITTPPAISLSPGYVEAVLCGLVGTVRYLSDDQEIIREVHFSHAPAFTDEHTRIFRCRLAFDQPHNQLVLAAADLDRPIFLANPAMLARFEALAQELLAQLDLRDGWTEQVGHRVGRMLLTGEKPTLERVAGTLAISPRHLQNKLRDEGTTYRDLLEQLRRETALRYLQDPETSICDIAFLLGFSDQSTFTHAFKRWTGKNPGDFRHRA